MGSSDILQYTFNIENSTEIIRSIRSGEQPPAHCKLDVNSFTQLTSSLPTTSPFFESTEFSVGNYRWIIQIYPYGNEKDDGDGHISIYLKLCDKLKSGSFINVIFRALIHDQERNKYLVIQDLREKRFDAANTIWGMSKAIPRTAFNAKSNGFLIQDRCTFGAEVFIINSTIPISAEVSTVDGNSTLTHTWRVDKFSELPDDAYSPEFTIKGRTWKLNVCPRGCASQRGKSLSLYLNLTQFYDLTAGNKLFTEFELRVKNQLNGEDRSNSLKQPFEKSAKSWGRHALVPLSDMQNPSKGLMMDDVVILEVCFKQMFMLTDN